MIRNTHNLTESDNEETELITHCYQAMVDEIEPSLPKARKAGPVGQDN